MTNKCNGTQYRGVTNDLKHRVYEHKHKLFMEFTSKYDLTRLVYHEATNDVTSSISREKQIKGWLRKKKIALIEMMNPEWNDLSEGWDIYREISCVPDSFLRLGMIGFFTLLKQDSE